MHMVQVQLTTTIMIIPVILRKKSLFCLSRRFLYVAFSNFAKIEAYLQEHFVVEFETFES